MGFDFLLLLVIENKFKVLYTLIIIPVMQFESNKKYRYIQTIAIYNIISLHLANGWDTEQISKTVALVLLPRYLTNRLLQSKTEVMDSHCKCKIISSHWMAQ